MENNIGGTRFHLWPRRPLAVVGGKWKPLVLFHLASGPRRFVSGISEKVLIQQLRELESDGILNRTDYREVPPRVEYSITEFGRTLATALMPLCIWGEQHEKRVKNFRRTQSAAAMSQAS
jgi:DNA-binding HxlR family transcriptional regulator